MLYALFSIFKIEKFTSRKLEYTGVSRAQESLYGHDFEK